MEPLAPLPAPAVRARPTVLMILALLGAATLAFVLRKPLMMVLPMCTTGRWDLCFGTFNGVGLVTFAAFPFAVLAVWVSARHRRAVGVAMAWRMSLAEVGIIYGTLPWLWITMLPGSRAGMVTGRVSLVPLRDLATMDAGQVVGNLLILAALGFFAPVRCAGLASLPRILALGAGCSILIEVAQYVLRLDRVSSVDDVLLNATGAALAAAASHRWWRTRGKPHHLPRPILARAGGRSG
jgi:hypothetical protein